MLRHPSLVFIICFLLLSVHAAYSDDLIDPFSYENIAGFAQWLIEQNEFYRAYYEFYRLHVYYPQQYPYEKLYAASLYCFMKGKQFREIISKTENRFTTDWWIWVYRFDSFFWHDYTALKDLIRTQPHSENPESEYFIKKRNVAYVLLTGSPISNGISGLECDMGEQSVRLYEYCETKRNALKLPYVSIVAGLFPGGGYIYSGNVETGIVAAIVVGVCAALTYMAVATNNYAIAFGTGTAGIFFYGGSILGGYLATHKENVGIIRELQEYIAQELKFEKDWEKFYIRYGKP